MARANRFARMAKLFGRVNANWNSFAAWRDLLCKVTAHVGQRATSRQPNGRDARLRCGAEPIRVPVGCHGAETACFPPSSLRRPRLPAFSSADAGQCWRPSSCRKTATVSTPPWSHRLRILRCIARRFASPALPCSDQGAPPRRRSASPTNPSFGAAVFPPRRLSNSCWAIWNFNPWRGQKQAPASPRGDGRRLSSPPTSPAHARAAIRAVRRGSMQGAT